MTPALLSPDDPRAPRFWMHEQSGVLEPVVRKYLDGAELKPHEVVTMRLYLRQWIDSPVWAGEPVERLRRSAGFIATTADVRRWLDAALDEGIDPL